MQLKREAGGKRHARIAGHDLSFEPVSALQFQSAWCQNWIELVKTSPCLERIFRPLLVFNTLAW